MGKRILTETNCIFRCSESSELIISINSTDTKCRDCGNAVLTNETSLSGNGICPVLTSMADGTPTPCTLINADKWISGIEFKKKINGTPLLNEKAKMKCPNLSCPTGIISAEVIGQSVSLSAAAVVVSFSGGESKSSSENHENTSMQSDSEENSVKTEQTAENPEQNEMPEEKSMCSYEYCERAGDCPYMRAPSTISTDGAALKLRKNSSQKETDYNERSDRNMEKYQISWNNQAHHIISINAAYCQYPELVKLGNYFGYDINCSENCYFLPCWKSGDGYGQKKSHFKKAQAYEVMKASGLQWHVGQHLYSISLPENILNKYPELKTLDCYNDRINKDVKKIIADCNQRFNGICLEENYDEHKKWFIQQMNSLSGQIEEYLDLFGETAKNSFPYFVSLEALRYAYEVPRSGKAVLIYKTETKWILKRYHYTNYLKDSDVKLELNEYKMLEVTENHRDETIKKIILFCENVTCFLVIDETMKFRLPFNYKVRLQYINGGKPESHFSAMLAEQADNGEDEYISPKAMVLQRLKECGLY